MKIKTKAGKRNLAVIIMAAAIVILALLYYFVVVPLTAEEEPEDDSQDLLEGEVIESGRILLFPHLQRADIAAVEIHNSYGKYTVYKDANDTLVLNGFESLSLDGNALSGIIVGAGYSLSMQRIVDHCDNMAEYGLADEQEPAWYKVTAKDGSSYIVYIGSKLLSGAAYYVRADGRDSVYAISNTLIDPLLLGKESIVSKQITSAVSSTNAATMIDQLVIYRHDDPVVGIKLLGNEEKEEYGLNTNYLMVLPTRYNVSTDAYSHAIEKFSNFAADSVLAVGITKAKLEKYGLTDPPYTLYFNYAAETGDEENLLYISEMNENGNYYVAAPEYDIIAEMSGSNLDFIEYDLLRWVDQPVFMVNINEVGSIVIDSPRVKETFTLEGENQELVVTTSGGIKPDVKNFRQFYKTLLSTNIQGYSELTEEEIAALSDKEPQLTFSYTTRADKTTTYKFYEISERKTVFTVNGEGWEFYLLYTQVNKISSDCIRIINGEPVDSEDRS